MNTNKKISILFIVLSLLFINNTYADNLYIKKAPDPVSKTPYYNNTKTPAPVTKTPAPVTKTPAPVTKTPEELKISQGQINSLDKLQLDRSKSYLSYEECQYDRDKYNQEYTNYFRTPCYKDGELFFYNLYNEINKTKVNEILGINDNIISNINQNLTNSGSIKNIISKNTSDLIKGASNKIQESLTINNIKTGDKVISKLETEINKLNSGEEKLQYLNGKEEKLDNIKEKVNSKNNIPETKLNQYNNLIDYIKVDISKTKGELIGNDGKVLYTESQINNDIDYIINNSSTKKITESSSGKIIGDKCPDGYSSGLLSNDCKSLSSEIPKNQVVKGKYLTISPGIIYLDSSVPLELITLNLKSNTQQDMRVTFSSSSNKLKVQEFDYTSELNIVNFGIPNQRNLYIPGGNLFEDATNISAKIELLQPVEVKKDSTGGALCTINGNYVQYGSISESSSLCKKGQYQGFSYNLTQQKYTRRCEYPKGSPAVVKCSASTLFPEKNSESSCGFANGQSYSYLENVNESGKLCKNSNNINFKYNSIDKVYTWDCGFNGLIKKVSCSTAKSYKIGDKDYKITGSEILDLKLIKYKK